MGPEDHSGIHYENPFVTPPGLREPVRQFRGRLAAPVTVWTSGDPEHRAALTVSSVVVADGQPASLFGLINDTTEVFDQIAHTGTFIVHLLESNDKVAADVFAGRRPSPGGLFEGLEVEDTPFGPAIASWTNRAFCRFVEAREAGYQRMVSGVIERIDLSENIYPLVYFRGRYRELSPGPLDE